MFVGVHKPLELKGSNNKGSSANLFEYLSKEDCKEASFDHFGEKAYFFSSDKDTYTRKQAAAIDANKGKLRRDQYKFYMLSINPSEAELKHIMRSVGNPPNSTYDSLSPK